MVNEPKSGEQRRKNTPGTPARRRPPANQPIYQEIAEDLRSRIQSGEFAQGDKLPTEEDLSDSYRASRNTVRQAIDRLARELLVAKRQGQGTFVTIKVDPFVAVLSTRTPVIDGGGMEGAPYESEVEEQHRVPSASKPKVEIQTCPREIALRLGIKPDDDDVISRHQKRFIDGVPWSLQTSYYPYELASKADRLLKAADIEEGTVSYLSETWGLDQVGYRDWTKKRTPNDEEQQFFKLGPDDTLYEVMRTAFARADSAQELSRREGIPDGYLPTRVTVTVYPADRNLLVSDYGDVPESLYEVEPKQQDLLSTSPDDADR